MYGKHTSSPSWQRNNHWVECDVCGYDYRAKEMRYRWDGAAVCKHDYEKRNEQEFVRGVPDVQTPTGIVSPEQPDVYVDVTYSLNGQEDAGA